MVASFSLPVLQADQAVAAAVPMYLKLKREALEPLIKVMQVARALNLLPAVVAELEVQEEEMPAPIMVETVVMVLHPVLRAPRFITALVVADRVQDMVVQEVREVAETAEVA